MRIFVPLFAFLLLLTTCAEPVPPPQPKIVPVQFGAFAFSITDDWKQSRSGDTLLLEKNGRRVTVVRGFHLTFLLFTPRKLDTIPWNGQRFSFLDAAEKERLRELSPLPQYPDSFPSAGPLRFSVSADSSLKRYTCFSDTSLFLSEFLAVHPESGNCIRFEAAPGTPHPDSLFALVDKTLRFVPDPQLPTLLAFTGRDTTMDCCYKELRGGKPNPFFAKNVLHMRGDTLEYRISPRFNGTYADKLRGWMRLKGDSIFLGVERAGHELVFFDEVDDWLLRPPGEKRLLCGLCYTCETVLFTIRLPGGLSRYAFVFDHETIASSDTLIP